MRGWRICSSARFFSESAKTIARSAARFKSPFAEKISVPKRSRRRRLHLLVLIGQLARRLIGIEKPRARQLLQAAGESGFAGGNTAGDPDDGAGFGHQVKVASKEKPSRLPSTLSVAGCRNALRNPRRFVAVPIAGPNRGHSQLELSRIAPWATGAFVLLPRSAVKWLSNDGHRNRIGEPRRPTCCHNYRNGELRKLASLSLFSGRDSAANVARQDQASDRSCAILLHPARCCKLCIAMVWSKSLFRRKTSNEQSAPSQGWVAGADRVPVVSFARVQALILPAFTIAIIGTRMRSFRRC